MLLTSSHISLFTDSLKVHLLSKYFSLQWPCVIICHYFIFYIWQYDLFDQFFYWQYLASISISPRLSAPVTSVFFISIFSFCFFPICFFWRTKWQPTAVFLPGKSHRHRSLVGFSPWGRKRVQHDWVTKPTQLIYFFLFILKTFFLSDVHELPLTKWFLPVR